MKLTAKIAVALILGFCVLLAIHAQTQIERATETFAADMREDQLTVGRLFRPTIARTWRTQGEAAAMYTLQYTNQTIDETSQTTTMSLRWVWLDESADEVHRPAVAIDRLTPLRSGDPVSVVATGADDVERLYTYISLSVGVEGERVGALEISEPTAKLDAFASLTRRRLLVTTLELLGLCAIIVLVVGTLLVARPLGRIAATARRIGEGNLDARCKLASRDEIGELSSTVDHMAESLQTARRELAAESETRERAVQQLRHADRLSTVGTLASGLAHELGTPLAVISGRAKMIADHTIEGEATSEYAESIARQADKMADIIRQLLEFARRRHISLAPKELGPLAEKSALLVEPLANKRGIEIQVSEHGEPTRAAVDAVQFQQVLTNLLVNAVHAMPGGGTIRVDLDRVRVVPPADHPGHDAGSARFIRIRVADDGEGMRPEILDKVFEPFFTTKQVGEGTGLGLAVSYGITQDHGGWISVESTPGIGSTFSIYLPMPGEQPGEQTAGDVETRSASSA